jgi:ligand-binding SRPBCC domain-containing protein
VKLSIGYPPFRVRWIAEHSDYVENRQFRDIEIRGPFRRWEHTHLIHADGPDACYRKDRVEYELPFGRIGAWLLGPAIQRKLERLFQYRHHVTQEENEAARA